MISEAKRPTLSESADFQNFSIQKKYSGSNLVKFLFFITTEFVHFLNKVCNLCILNDLILL